jgi:hypothetical protein
VNYLPGMASYCDPLDLCLPSSWDYRCEPLVPDTPGTLRHLDVMVPSVWSPQLPAQAGGSARSLLTGFVVNFEEGTDTTCSLTW